MNFQSSKLHPESAMVRALARTQPRLTLFNFIVTAGAWPDARDELIRNRIFEHTDQHLVDRFAPGGQLATEQLMQLPTMFVQEGRDAQVVQFGRLTASFRAVG